MHLSLRTSTIVASLLAWGSSAAWGVIPYTPVPVSGTPVVGPGLSAPDGVYGKEYSHDFDFSTIGPVADPEQIIAWDGTGGTADDVDYSFTRPTWLPDQEIDAIANTRDALYDELLRDESHLIFSHDDMIVGYGPGGGFMPLLVPSAGPITITNGNMIGGAGELSVEMAGMFAPPSVQFTWATQPVINGMPLPDDVDGVEVWGPEPTAVNPDGTVKGDSDKYSLQPDFPSGISVWNGSGSPYIGHPLIVAAVEALLGPIPPSAFSFFNEQQGRNAINLDALMVSDIIEDGDIFHQDVAGGIPGGEELLDQNGTPIEPFGVDGTERGDSIVFSIRQIIDPADPDGYYATGSELIVLDSLFGPSFLRHGGHVWDHGYSLVELGLVVGGGPNDVRAIIDINAIEAIGEDVVSTTTPVLPGDYNDDGKVNAADWVLWRNYNGTAHLLPNDLTPGMVNLVDLAVWRSNFGSMLGPGAGAGSGASAVVPEPSSAMLIIGLAVTAFAYRPRRHV
jgi:hypothetical protein